MRWHAVQRETYTERRYEETHTPPHYESLKLLGQLRDDFEQVADEAHVGDLEDGRFLILVDGDDGLRILHSRQVLDRAGNADSDIDFGGDDLAGLADLVIVGRIAGIDRGAAGADARAKLVGKRVEQGMELVGGAEGAAAGDDDLGAGQLGPLRLAELGADEARFARRGAGVDRLDRAAAAFRGRFLKGRAADRDDLLGILRLDRGDGVAGVDRPGERVLAFD